MRLVATALWLALGAAVTAPAPAQAQVPLPPLAPREVALQTIGLGQVTTPADRVLIRTSVSASGEDDAGAGRALRARLDRLNAILRAAGIPTDDVMTGDTSVSRDDSTASSSRALNALLEQGRAPSARLASGWPTTTATVPLSITLRDVSRLAALREQLAASGLTVAPPEYFLANDGVPRRQAREQAVRKARADAETQAALLDMRVARVMRISERTSADIMGLMANETPAVMRNFASIWRVQLSEVETVVAVGVEFALAPR